jgi:hypothetical protein
MPNDKAEPTRHLGGSSNTGNTCYVNASSWLAARLAAHVEAPRDVAASPEAIDAANFAASAELEESMEAFQTEDACALRRLVAFSDIQQNLSAAAVNEEQLKRQLDETHDCFTTATTQQDPYLLLESFTCAHQDFTFRLTTNTQCHTCQYLLSQHFPKTSLSLLPASGTLHGCLNDFMPRRRRKHIGDTGTAAEPAIDCP